MAVVTAHPLPADPMQAGELIQFSPEVLVFLPFPAQGHGLDQQLRIRMENDRLGRKQEFQSFDGGSHFHAVVRGLGTVAGSLQPTLTILNDIGPASGAGIPEATAVGIDEDVS